MPGSKFKHRAHLTELRVVLDSIDDVSMLNDNVLVEIDNDISKNYIKNGLWMSLDASKSNARNTIRHGIVRKLPREFVFKEDYWYGTDWKSTIQIKENDRVWFGVVGSAESSKFIVGDKLYFIIPYRELIVAKRKFTKVPTSYKYEFVVEEEGRICEVVMLNGYMLVQPRTDTSHEFLDLPKKNSKQSVVCFCGEPNIKYYNNHFSDNSVINVGDCVRLDHINHKYLEDKLHLSFDDEQEYMVIQRRHLTYKY